MEGQEVSTGGATMEDLEVITEDVGMAEHIEDHLSLRE